MLHESGWELIVAVMAIIQAIDWFRFLFSYLWGVSNFSPDSESSGVNTDVTEYG